VTAGVSFGDATLAIDSSESVWFLTPTAPARWRSVSLRPALAPPAVAGRRRGAMSVRDLDAAESALESRGMAADRTTTAVAIDAAPLEGLDLRLTATPPSPAAR
jgi:hypothetical protein